MEQNIANGANVVQHNHSNDPNFKKKPLFLKFFQKNVHARDIVSQRALKKDIQYH